MAKQITFKTVTNIDFNNTSGFFVEAGRAFSPSDYCEAYGLNIYDFDDESIKAAQNAAAGLNPGDWLEIDHES